MTYSKIKEYLMELEYNYPNSNLFQMVPNYESKTYKYWLGIFCQLIENSNESTYIQQTSNLAEIFLFIDKNLEFGQSSDILSEYENIIKPFYLSRKYDLND
jgi:hypothetical protein